MQKIHLAQKKVHLRRKVGKRKDLRYTQFVTESLPCFDIAKTGKQKKEDLFMSNTITTSQERDAAVVERQRRAFSSAEGKAAHRKNIKLLFAISLVVTFVLAILNWGIISSWGAVSISRMTLSGTNGEKMSVLLYKPDSATAENPAPAVICYHGNAGNARNHESWAVEFSRRGFVVVVPDMLGAGNSDTTASELLDYETMFVNGFTVYDHVLTMDYVDPDNIFTSGHSMGGTTAYAAAAQCNAKGVLIASNRIASHLSKKTDEPSMALYEKVQGYVGDVIMVYGDVERGISDQAMIDLGNQWIDAKVQRGYEGYAGVKCTQTDTVYGSFEEGNALMVSTDSHRVHEGAFVNSECIGKLVDFAQQAADQVPNYIDAKDQVWMYKDYVGLLATLSFGVFICALALVLIETVPYFEDIKYTPTRNIGLRGPGMAITVALGIVLPFVVLKTNAFGLGNAFLDYGTPEFTQMKLPDLVQGVGPFHLTYACIAMGVVIALTLCGILGFGIFFFTDGKKVKLNAADLGLCSENGKITFSTIWKPLSLTLIVVAISFALLQLLEDLTGTTLYSWFFGFKAVAMNKVQYYPAYMIVWMLCFVFSSFTLNVERRLPTTGNDILDTVLQIVFNVFMVTFTINAVIVICWCNESYSLNLPALIGSYQTDIAKIWGMPVGMTVATCGSTLLFRNTRNTWLSAFLMGSVAALMACTYGLLRIYG